jgi:hypothetical protein
MGEMNQRYVARGWDSESTGPALMSTTVIEPETDAVGTAARARDERAFSQLFERYPPEP